MTGLSEPLTTTPVALDTPDTSGTFAAASALSRFEFETGRGNEGTKILMVEWDTLAGRPESIGAEPLRPGCQDGHSHTRATMADQHWDIKWEGKPASVLAVRDADPEQETNGRTRRLLYLLPPNAPIPTLVTIAPVSNHSIKPGQQPAPMTAKPMPAIFPTELGSDAAAGYRGVLHMLWARKRLAALRSEIDAEMRENGESVGLEMALQERRWIQDHFAPSTYDPTCSDSPLQQRDQSIPAQNTTKSPSISPTSPKSPAGNRLGEKLRGLKLATSPADLAGPQQVVPKIAANKPHSLVTILTPDTSGVTVPASLRPFGGSNPLRGATMDSIVVGGGPPINHGSNNDEEDLFCLPLSPRSPDMARSPFSFL